MSRPLRLVITTGDPDGIGLEVTSKALYKLGPQSGTHFIIWRSQRPSRRYLDLIDKKFNRITVNSWHEAVAHAFDSPKDLVDIRSTSLAPHWVETSARASLFGHVDAMVTAPLSKTLIREAGFTGLGHTEILGHVCGVDRLFMGFVGDKFNVTLSTGHIPLKEVGAALKVDLVRDCILAAEEMRGILDSKMRKRPLAVVGLNPHAGEEGLIGSEESQIIREAMQIGIKKGIPMHDKLLVPDVAFQPENWKKYSIFVCMYHDQGLIPFKLVHGQSSGIQITLGLPFIRTSVDHGTAKDIFGRNKANPSSMVQAIDWAIKLSRKGSSTIFAKGDS